MLLDYYYDILTKIENFVDGIMVVDERGFIRFHKSFAPEGASIREETSIGKRPEDIFSNLTRETSTVYQALDYGKTSISQVQQLRFPDGHVRSMLDNTFPIRESGKIIGAISVSKFLSDDSLEGFIDLSHMTTSKNKDSMYTLENIIGTSPAISRLKMEIAKVARSSSSVLIHGDSGTGKELVAQSLHSSSPRRNKLFISQNCSAIPHTLLESIFFGTKKGSYTGSEDRPGIFEIADGGTIFFDEINSMDLSMQAKLLKAIEEKKITRIGESTPRKVDVRILSAINRPLEESLQEKELRKDLYYRLSTIQLYTPSLQQRKSDLPILSQFFIQHFNGEFHRKIVGLSPEVESLFQEYTWPGNVRELRNVIECAFNFASSPHIYPEDLPDYLQSLIHKDSVGPSHSPGTRPFEKYFSQTTPFLENSSGKEAFPEQACLSDKSPLSSCHISLHPWKDQLSLKHAVDLFEKTCLENALAEDLSLTDLSKRLGLTRQGLYQKLKKYNLG